MNYQELINKFPAREIPTGVLGAAGVLLLLLSIKAARMLVRFIFVFAAFALLGAALWWHLHAH